MKAFTRRDFCTAAAAAVPTGLTLTARAQETPTQAQMQAALKAHLEAEGEKARQEKKREEEARDKLADAVAARMNGRFRFCLNTGTIRGYKLSLAEQIEVAIKCGYGGIEPWVSDVAEAAKTEGALKRLAARCKDGGLSVVSAIGFAQWAVNDDDARAKGMEQMKRDMALVAELGGTHIAAPPAGINGADYPAVGLDAVAERYRAVLELGRGIGVIPQIEFWGSAKNLSRLEECITVAAYADHPDACVLADAFHAYKGGSSFNALRLLGRGALHCFHINDYPADPPRATVRDSDRVWPGDGIAPLKGVLSSFRDNHADVWLSVEVFNQEYWKTDAETTAKTGLEKMRVLVQ